MPEAQTSPAPANSSMLNIAIVEQIEYYFGDFNMMKDKFLKQEITKNDGWIPIQTLLHFNRLAALTKDIDIILVAFSDNPSTLVEVNNETKSIRRVPDRPLPENDEVWRAAIAKKSIYIKGFPSETTAIDNILKFLQPFGKIDNVFMRKYFDKALKEWKFKGSVFVAFPTVEDAERFLSIGSMKYEGKDLIRMWQNDYIEKKKNERLENKIKSKELKNKLLNEQRDSVLHDMKALPTGALVELSGLNKEIHLNKLKSKLVEMKWDVAFIDYTTGETTAFVRLQAQDSAKVVIDQLKDKTFEFDGIQIKASLVEGEKEEEKLKMMKAERESKVLENMMKSKDKKKGKKYGINHSKRQENRAAVENGDMKTETLTTKNETKSMEQGEENTLKRKVDESIDDDHLKKLKSEH